MDIVYKCIAHYSQFQESTVFWVNVWSSDKCGKQSSMNHFREKREQLRLLQLEHCSKHKSYVKLIFINLCSPHLCNTRFSPKAELLNRPCPDHWWAKTQPPYTKWHSINSSSSKLTARFRGGPPFLVYFLFILSLHILVSLWFTTLSM